MHLVLEGVESCMLVLVFRGPSSDAYKITKQDKTPNTDVLIGTFASLFPGSVTLENPATPDCGTPQTDNLPKRVR